MTDVTQPDDQPVEESSTAMHSDRRQFIRRALTASAVAVPVVSSFSMTGMRPSLNMAFGASAPNSEP